MKVDVVLRDWEGEQNKGKIRHVNVPEDQWEHAKTLEDKLEAVFMFGQNDMQRQPMRSVSVGDVIRLGGKEYAVRSSGFGTEFSDEPAPMPFFGDAFPRITEVEEENSLDFKDQDAVQAEREAKEISGLCEDLKVVDKHLEKYPNDEDRTIGEILSDYKRG